MMPVKRYDADKRDAPQQTRESKTNGLWHGHPTREIIGTCPVMPARPPTPLDNARVNRADEKCKLVKMESDTMGARDHPTTGQRQS